MALITLNAPTDMRIDLAQAGLRLGAADVLALSDSSDRLLVTAEGAYSHLTTADSGWMPAGTPTTDGAGFHRYTLGGATLLVEFDLAATIS